MTTTTQQQQALDRANEIRSYRALLKKNIAGFSRQNARDFVCCLIMAPEPMDYTMKLREAIDAIPRVGSHLRDRALARAQVPYPDKKLGTLTDGQRLRLCDAIRDTIHR